MSSTKFKTEDYADFRLNVALKRISQEVLSLILNYAIKKLPQQSFFEYLFVTNNIQQKLFDTAQKDKLRNTSSESFDITLLFKIFLHGCSEIAPSSDSKWKSPTEFEFHLKKLKDLRNEIIHSALPIPYTDLPAKMAVIHKVLMELIEVASNRFNISDSVIEDIKAKVDNDINTIQKSPLTQTDIDEYLLSEGVFEAKLRYRKFSYINPVDFFVGVEFSANIDDIFVSIELKELEGCEIGQKIETKFLLRPCNTLDTSLIVVEGLAGSGKTTLVKYILSRWVNGDTIIKGLNKFDFIIFLQCNNAYINSVYDLISSVMPDTSRRFEKDKLIESLLCKELLIVVDGVDEAHNGTKAVLKELFNKTCSRNVKFFCTSRPEKIQWVYRSKGELKCASYSILGIPCKRRGEFIEKLHRYYMSSPNCPKERMLSSQHVIKTLENLPIVIKHEMRLPLFLTLFTYFCIIEPQKVSCLSTVFSLYNELISALKEKLCSRSMLKSEEDKEEEEIKDEIETCFKILCKQSYISLSENNSLSSWKAFQSIRTNTQCLGLTIKEVLSAFLVIKVVLTPTGVEETIGFPHKGLQEFLAAKAIIEELKEGKSLCEIFQILEIVSTETVIMPTKPKELLDLNTDFMKYQNLLRHLADLIAFEGLITDEIVTEVLRCYKKAGVYYPKQWLDLFSALKNHCIVSEYILTKFKKLDIDENDLDSLIELLKFGCPPVVILRMKTSSFSTIEIKTVLTKLSYTRCNLKLLFKKHFIFPLKHSSCNYLNILLHRKATCSLTWFEGSLNEHYMKLLPTTVHVLWLGIGSQEQAKALRVLSSGIHSIYFIKLHVERNVLVADLSPVNLSTTDFILYLSDVQNSSEDITWCLDVIVKLNEKKIYREITFARSKINKKNLIYVLKKLQKFNIKILKEMKISSSEINKSEYGELSKLARASIGGDICLVDAYEIFEDLV